MKDEERVAEDGLTGGHDPIREERSSMRKVMVLESLLDEVSINLPRNRNEKNFNPEGGSEMIAINNRRTRVCLERPSAYPLPKGLLTVS